MKILTYQSDQTPFSFSALERLQLPVKTCCDFALSSCCPMQQCPKHCVSQMGGTPEQRSRFSS